MLPGFVGQRPTRLHVRDIRFRVKLIGVKEYPPEVGREELPDRGFAAARYAHYDDDHVPTISSSCHDDKLVESGCARCGVAFARPVTKRDAPALDGEPGIRPDDDDWHAGWARVAMALVLAGQGMTFGLAANIAPPSGATYWWLHGGLLASALIVFALLGQPLLRECISAFRAGRITVDMLFLLSLAGALAASLVSTVRGTGPIFYELVAVLLSIYTVGKLLGARSRARVTAAVNAIRTDFDSCLVMRGAATEVRRAVEVQLGDHVLVRAGDRVAVDGRILSGEGLVATTPLTGEPEPRLLQPGEPIFAGMQSIDGAFTVEVGTEAGARSLDELLRKIEEARLRPSRLQATADRVASRFVPLVAAVAVATLVGWWFFGAGWAVAVENSLAVLVVACPCALGLATPLGIWAGLARLGRVGLIARSGDFLDGLAAADAALFDKTGTLCEQDLTVVNCRVLTSCPLDREKLQATLAVVEAGTDHPVAAALRAAFAHGTNNFYELIDSRVVPGRGIRASVRCRATRIVYRMTAGSARLMEEAGVAFPHDSTTDVPRIVSRNILVAIDDTAAAQIVLDEKPRGQVAKVFAELRELGLSVEILTGDAGFSANRWPDVPRQVGLTPAEKADWVQRRKDEGKTVLFVGDGLNDGPALAEADVALAIREGADLARSNALGVIAGSSLGVLPEAVRIARRVRRAITTNLRFAAIYNTVGMTVAAAGWLHPVLAAVLMAASSALVSFRVVHHANAED